MNILLNGVSAEISSQTLADALNELGFAEAKVATAINGSFVPAPMRSRYQMNAGDQLEVLAPMQGG